MDARIRDLHRAASAGDLPAREQLWWETYRLGLFGPGSVIGGAREAGTVDPSAGFRAVLKGMAFLGDVAARRVWTRSQAEYEQFASTLGPHVTVKDKIPTKLTQQLLTFSFGTIGASALACALVRFAVERWGQEIRYGTDTHASEARLRQGNQALRGVLDRLEAAEAMIPLAIERTRRLDERGERDWRGIVNLYQPGSPGLPGLPAGPDLYVPGLLGTLLHVANDLGEAGLMGRSWRSAMEPVITTWASVARGEIRRRSKVHFGQEPRQLVIAVNREIRAYCLARLAPLMSMGIVP